MSPTEPTETEELEEMVVQKLLWNRVITTDKAESLDTVGNWFPTFKKREITAFIRDRGSDNESPIRVHTTNKKKIVYIPSERVGEAMDLVSDSYMYDFPTPTHDEGLISEEIEELGAIASITSLSYILIERSDYSIDEIKKIMNESGDQTKLSAEAGRQLVDDLHGELRSLMDLYDENDDSDSQSEDRSNEK